ncbi:ASCH domain-containing protein [Lactobacillus sp. ESL0791]|uniref:ASCH domain-containing protein n=1 Tax=Lactobacillus sp. ESL0791 TaxID=2983234 RepID=UPI0023F70436|nr:ASCH domain-containing protein [Lactobacillus sp. ESL0791]MDF7638023.1 ASCH domain-containing protein [Lactobacillus sp. ESL0791]
MTTEMGLNHEQLLLIKGHTKTIEIRLNDEKRRKLCVADTINFIDTETGETLAVKIKQLETFTTFAALFTKYKGAEVGSAPTDSLDKMVSDMYKIYSPEQEHKYGAMAITVAPI